jgi:hypothetical protein
MLTRRKALEVPSHFESIGDVAAGLAALDRQFRSTRDLRGLFVMAYIATTDTIAQWIDRGVFRDNQAMARYVVAFANEYRRSLSRWVAGERVGIPVAWQQSFDACEERSAGVFRCLMLGINAHMNRDLPYAVIKAGVDLNCAGCYQDYVRIDDVLSLNMPLVRGRIAEAFGSELPFIQRWLGQFAGAGIDRGFRRDRQNSWAFAQMLAAAKTKPARVDVDRAIEQRAAAEGERILGLARMVA